MFENINKLKMRHCDIFNDSFMANLVLICSATFVVFANIEKKLALNMALLRQKNGVSSPKDLCPFITSKTKEGKMG